MRIYVDESGNSGLKLNDNNQSIYSCAGVWINDADEAELPDFLDKARRRYNIQSKDIKGSDLVQNRSGRKAIEFFAQRLVESSTYVTIIIVNKKFLCAGWIIEDCLDTANNDHPDITNKWTLPGKHKKLAADEIASVVNDQLLTHWWIARTERDVAKLKAATVSVAQLLIKQNKESEIGSLLGGFSAERCLAPDVNTQALIDGMSPNVIAFNTLIQRINQLASKLSRNNIDLVHDQQRQFQTSFAQYANLTMNLGGSPNAPITFTLPTGQSVTYRIDVFRTVTFEDSKKTAGLQIADCFAAVGRRLGEMALRRVTGKSSDTVEDISIINSLLELNRKGLLDWHVIGPEAWSDNVEDLVTPKFRE